MLTESMLVDLVPKIRQRTNFINQLEKTKKSNWSKYIIVFILFISTKSIIYNN